MKFKKILFPVIGLSMCSFVFGQQLRCDQLAASPHDSEKVTAGVPYDKINSSIAIPACREAVERNPKVSRLWFQYGRALEKGNKIADAIIAYQEAIKFNHAAALNNIGELYRDGKGFEKNPRKAEEFFAKAAQYGSTEGAANLKDVNKEKSPPKEVSVEPRREQGSRLSRADYEESERLRLEFDSIDDYRDGMKIGFRTGRLYDLKKIYGFKDKNTFQRFKSANPAEQVLIVARNSQKAVTKASAINCFVTSYSIHEFMSERGQQVDGTELLVGSFAAILQTYGINPNDAIKRYHSEVVLQKSKYNSDPSMLKSGARHFDECRIAIQTYFSLEKISSYELE
jgi:hypothetical protein